MSSLSNINNNSSVINVGRTTPVTPGQQEAAKSIPVVLASDQSPVPVVEQNKIQSEVALSLLGIPRSEVALGIFADVNTYDVNPMEWSAEPATYTPGFGIKHLPDEAGALIQAPKNEFSILTSKRFFRYQPGRVSAATFGVKSTVSPEGVDRNPAIRKYGIFDKFDGYYWETMRDGVGDQFSVVRRTQSLLKYIPVPFSGDSGVNPKQNQDYGQAGKAPSAEVEEPNAYPVATKLLTDNRYQLVEDAWAAVLADPSVSQVNVKNVLNGLSPTNRAKYLRDMDHTLDAYIWDLQYGGNGHTVANAAMFIALSTTTFIEPGFVLYTKLQDQITTLLTNNGETGASGRISNPTTGLSKITLDVFRGDGLGNYTSYNILSNSQIASLATYGNRSKISTVFAVYTRFLGYYGSKYVQDLSSLAISNASYVNADQEYRVYRDVCNIVDGYAKDLEFGGNARTVFNAKDYYRSSDGINTFIDTDLTDNATEAKRHKLVQTLMTSPNPVQLGTITFSSVFTRFGLTATYSTRAADLTNLIIGNFSDEYTGNAEFGAAPLYGNLVILRDNLIMTHAAVHDPSLLKPKKQVVARFNPDNIDYPNTIEVAEGDYVVGQYINCIDQGDSPTLVNGKMYKVISVRGTKANILKLGDPMNDDIEVDFDTNIGECIIEPNVPFIFPEDYYQETANTFARYDGAFPYMYVDSGTLPHSPPPTRTSGFIDTAYNVSDAGSLTSLKQEIDRVNLLYNDWIKQNVDPKYYAVYEYRVPRSRFSTDQLNGAANNTVYSDTSTDSVGGRVYPGQPVLADSGAQLVNTSVWNLDFTKVSMLKVEFSWYGAVGALFLAYVPVGNGEARWVRVHHLRASNQLKISSLGNATLPITYLVYGGGSVNRLGLDDNTEKGYNSSSNHIVKYGASYYIDGGDRGTVRLYSYSNDTPVDVYGARYDIGTLTVESDSLGSYIDVNGVTGLPVDLTFFMNAKLLTSSRADQNVEILWVSGTKLYLNKSSLSSNNNLKLIANRASVLFGLKAKQNILNATGVGVRNRVQVYPTKLATANIGTVPTPVKMKVLKTPYFQPNITPNGTFTLSSNYTVTPENENLPTTSDYLANNGDYVYGWFRAIIGQNEGTVFGKLYKDDGLYYFGLLETFSEPVILNSAQPFLKEGRFDAEGNTLTVESESAITKERLSSVFVSTQIQSPVPKSGIEIASFFLKPGSDQFDLLSYFDYNKEYLSYPLTNQVDSLYLVSDSSQASSSTAVASISASLTWEEQ